MATNLREVYKCDKCGNMVEVVHASVGTLVCCGQNMTLQAENTKDAAVEKHIPVIEKIDGGYKVSVGSVAHPMSQEHYIEWIELLDGNMSQIQFLSPGQLPVAEFKTASTSVSARAYCNLHGFWKSA